MRRAVVCFVVALVVFVPWVGADEWGECAGMADNAFRELNCDFTDGVNHWSFDSVMGFWAVDPLNGFPSAPCGHAEAVDPQDYAFTITSECMPVLAATEYSFGLYARTPGGATLSCAGRIEEYAAGDCSGTPTISPDAPFTPLQNQWGSWAVSWITGAGSSAAKGVVECSADASFTVLFDNVAAVQGSELPVELQSFEID